MHIKAGLVLSLTVVAVAVAGEEDRREPGPPGVLESKSHSLQSAAPLDAQTVFDLIVRRYRALENYRDTSRLVQVIDRYGEDPARTETQVMCEIEGNHLTVTTPQRELARRLGIPDDIAPNDKVRDAQREYDFWLAPHMAMKFANAPLTEMRPGVCEAFTPTEAERITIDDRDMVHLELKTGDRQSEDYEAKFDLFVNPDSMLIERIEGNQRLPDGAHCLTTLEITPEAAEAAAPESTASPAPTAIAPGPDTSAIPAESFGNG